MTLVEFLRARLDEDEQVARAATSGPWEWQTFHDVDELVHPHEIGGHPVHPMNVLKAPHEDWPPNAADKAHIARHDPARVLDDVAAKRALLKLHWRAVDESDAYVPPATCDECGSYYPCTSVRLLALPYAGHPEYRPEWAP